MEKIFGFIKHVGGFYLLLIAGCAFGVGIFIGAPALWKRSKERGGWWTFALAALGAAIFVAVMMSPRSDCSDGDLDCVAATNQLPR